MRLTGQRQRGVRSPSDAAHVPRAQRISALRPHSGASHRLLDAALIPWHLPRRGSTHRPCRAGAGAAQSDQASGSSQDGVETSSTADGVGPALATTLKVLEWDRLCGHVAMFAQTTLGQRACTTLRPPGNQVSSERALAATRAVMALTGEYAAELDFGGIQTAQASDALRRAARGGVLSGPALQSVCTLLQGTGKLQKAIEVAARQAEATGHEVLAPLAAAVRDLPTLPELTSEIGFAIQEDGSVREAASDEVKKAAGKVRTVENRLRGVLRSQIGEIAEMGGRMCVAVPAAAGGAGGGPPRGVLLGTAPGGGTWFVELPAAVPLNNDLLAAKAELYGAEEAVRWRLTGRVSEAGDALTTALRAVVWLDATSARARYGRWIGGTLPEFVPFPKTGKARGGARKRAAATAAAAAAGGGEEDDDAEASGGRHFVYLRKLRHPLLLGDRLLAESSGGSRRSSSSSSGGAAREQRLPGWRANYSSGSDSGSGDESGWESADEGMPPAPVPIDVCVSAATKAVIITGPNTGGKTAALKALGLAVAMAQVGLPLPADDPVQLPCFDAVLADIGDEQSLSASLSTYSGHLRRIEALRRESTGKSLVLLDELGTGAAAFRRACSRIALLGMCFDVLMMCF